MFYWLKDKPKEVVCTICSREKAQGPLLMPARKRYLGAHIDLVASAARRRPFFILSGVMGLIPADTNIPYYDHRLADGEVDKLAARITQQVRYHKIRVLHYYFEPDLEDHNKPKRSWQPYTMALTKGVIAGGGGMVFVSLPTNREIAAVLPYAADAPTLA